MKAQTYHHLLTSLLERFDLSPSAPPAGPVHWQAFLKALDPLLPNEQDNTYLLVFKKIFDEATEGIAIQFLEKDCIEVNPAFCRMVRQSCTTVDKWSLQDFALHFDPRTRMSARRDLAANGSYHGEAIMTASDHTPITVWLTIDTIYDDATRQPTHRVAMITDISQLEASRRQLHFVATHDQLTQLPNRTMLIKKLDLILASHRRNHKKGALLFIDLDNFKTINDTAGHAVGDRVLIECTSRIARQLRPHDTFGRLGGDEFLIVLEGLHHRESAAYMARKILHTLKKPFHCDEKVFELGASIGIAFFPQHGTRSETLIHHADLAMYQAKKRGKNRFFYYNQSLEKAIRTNHRIEQALRSALEHDGFHLLYQPIIDAMTGRVVSVEALLRMSDTTVPSHNEPDVFIAIAEQSGLILKIGQWVFHEACRQLAEWRAEGVEDLVIAVNISRRQLNDESWDDFVRETLQQYHLSPTQIDLEITETALMTSPGSGVEAIRRLKRAGFHISIDDFGTGFSSLSNLKNFSMDKLKIDKSFIGGIMTNGSDHAIVAASITLGHAMGLTVIAEGVETDAQRRKLLQSGCDEMQGFLLGRPGTAEETLRLLRQTHSG